jgi:concanavalin A-like lectin/glucanase superfamily protein
VLDLSGSGNDGTIQRAIWTAAGHSGSALSFGSNTWVTIADAASLDLTNGMTLEAWVRSTSNNNPRTIIYKERSTGFSYALFGSDSSSHPTTSVRTNANFSANGPSPIPTNVWTHLAATYDGTRVRLFVNGVEIDNNAGGLADHDERGSAPDRWQFDQGEYFRGLIDDVRIYNRALSAAEIQADMATPVR